MNDELERHHTEAEAIRHEHELARQAAERARNEAEASRVTSENRRRQVAEEVSDTVEMLMSIVKRMEAVEALRREARAIAG
jgi:hypothetical protein